MRHSIFRTLLTSLVLSTSTISAAIVYSGVQNVAVPLDFNGIYINVITTEASSSEPGSWPTAPWINPFFGGTQIATSDNFRSVITGTDQIVNLSLGSVINGSRFFAIGASGSTTHVGNGLDQFEVGTLGYIAFQMKAAPGGTTLYGWMSMTVNNAGIGFIHDWAYETTGAELFTGLLSVPEPGRAMYMMLGALIVFWHRRRGV